jgi:PIN domain nuclease of toxin-antitoxin system
LKLLLDTHALLWVLSAPDMLPAGLRETLEDPVHIVYVSAASVWEMAIKQARGKLRYPANALTGALRRATLLALPVTIRHAEAAATLPPLHRDPFDRLLVAQAQAEGLALVSRDSAVRQYAVTVLWEPGVKAPRAPYRVKPKPRRRR